jgi:hypothetical protein
MNKMHTLAKIILSAIGIFFSIRLLSQLPYAIFVFYSKPSWQTAASSLFALSLTAALIAMLLYLFFYKNESLARKIVGSEQLPEPESQIQWLPVSLRLICIAGGIYLLSNFLWRTTYIIDHLARFESQTYLNESKTYVQIYTGFAYFSFYNLLPWILTLTCGVYLLYGAPHFVRWHVKKILQQCKDEIETT